MSVLGATCKAQVAPYYDVRGDPLLREVTGEGFVDHRVGDAQLCVSLCHKSGKVAATLQCDRYLDDLRTPCCMTEYTGAHDICAFLTRMLAKEKKCDFRMVNLKR